jgi:hypothetical protein
VGIVKISGVEMVKQYSEDKNVEIRGAGEADGKIRERWGDL